MVEIRGKDITCICKSGGRLNLAKDYLVGYITLSTYLRSEVTSKVIDIVINDMNEIE